jgi:MFS family permease
MFGKTSDNRTFHALCVMYFLLWTEWGVSTGMLPIYLHELGGSPVEVGLIYGVFAGISVFSMTFWGVVSDYFGRRKIFIVFGMGAITPIFLSMSLQKEILHLILLRGSTAIFKGAVVPTAWALVSDISTSENVGSNMGILGSTELAGFAFGPFIGGILADVFGFPSLWLFVAAECIVGALIFLILGSDPSSKKRGSRKIVPEVFGKKELVSKISVLYVSFPIFLLGFTLLGPNLNVYLSDGLGFSRTMVGLLSFVGMGVAALTQPIVGSYSDRHGRRPFLILGALSLFMGNIVLFFARDLPLIGMAQILIGNYSIFQYVGSAYISDIVPQTDRSATLGLFSSIGAVSRSLGPIIGGYTIIVMGIPSLILLSSVFPALSIAIVFFLIKKSKK